MGILRSISKLSLQTFYVRERKKRKNKQNRANVQTKTNTQTKGVEEDAILGHKTKIKFQTREMRASSWHIAHLSAGEYIGKSNG